MSTPHVVVVMGVAGTGKTTIGPLLAAELGVPYAEGDDFHPCGQHRQDVGGYPAGRQRPLALAGRDRPVGPRPGGARRSRQQLGAQAGLP